jgi:hypothetical protein
MQGTFHVRFLGEEVAVMPASLPDHTRLQNET